MSTAKNVLVLSEE